MTPDELPSVFAAGWSLPKPNAFLDHFRPVLARHATFSQPMFPDAHGITEIEHMFVRLFRLLPDLSLTVSRAAVAREVVYIESACAATLGREPVTFSVCDRFTVAGGLIRTRRSFSDPLPVLLAGLRHPPAWPRLLRSHLRGRRP